MGVEYIPESTHSTNVPNLGIAIDNAPSRSAFPPADDCIGYRWRIIGDVLCKTLDYSKNMLIVQLRVELNASVEKVLISSYGKFQGFTSARTR